MEDVRGVEIKPGDRVVINRYSSALSFAVVKGISKAGNVITFDGSVITYSQSVLIVPKEWDLSEIGFRYEIKEEFQHLWKPQ